MAEKGLTEKFLIPLALVVAPGVWQCGAWMVENKKLDLEDRRTKDSANAQLQLSYAQAALEPGRTGEQRQRVFRLLEAQWDASSAMGRWARSELQALNSRIAKAEQAEKVAADAELTAIKQANVAAREALESEQLKTKEQQRIAEDAVRAAEVARAAADIARKQALDAKATVREVPKPAAPETKVLSSAELQCLFECQQYCFDLPDPPSKGADCHPRCETACTKNPSIHLQRSSLQSLFSEPLFKLAPPPR